MTKEEAIAKIKKILNTNGRTESEADTYQQLAAALADRYSIDISALDRDEHERAMTVTEVTVGRWTKVPIEATLAAAICRMFFDVESIEVNGWSDVTHHTERRIQFIGLDYQCVIGQHVFDFVVAQFRRAWNQRTTRSKRRSAFMQGLYLGLRGKLWSAQHSRVSPAVPLALVVTVESRVKRYVEEHYPKLTSAPLASFKGLGGAGDAGRRAGREIEIRPAVPTRRPAAALIGG